MSFKNRNESDSFSLMFYVSIDADELDFVMAMLDFVPKLS